MKNAATGIGLAILGLGIAVNGLNLNGNQANATTAAPVAFNGGPAEPTIVWYGMVHNQKYNNYQPSCGGCYSSNEFSVLARAWSDGTVEAKKICTGSSCGGELASGGGWFVVASPNEGLNAAADINHDEIVNAADIGLLVAAWGDAPRNPMPPSDCPPGLIPCDLMLNELTDRPRHPRDRVQDQHRTPGIETQRITFVREGHFDNL